MLSACASTSFTFGFSFSMFASFKAVFLFFKVKSTSCPGLVTIPSKLAGLNWISCSNSSISERSFPLLNFQVTSVSLLYSKLFVERARLQAVERARLQ